MSKLYLLPILVLTLVVSGCGTKEITLQNKEQQAENLVSKNTSWCTKAEMNVEAVSIDENGLWISSEYYQGMNHAPTVRHICRGEQEVFYLQMDWDDNASLHTGNLIALSGASKFPIFSVNKDPAVELVEDKDNEDSNQVRISVDRQVIIYDEVSNVFKSENNQNMEASGQSLERVIYNIFNVEKKNQKFYFTIASSKWLSGDKAVELALKETGCPVARIRDGDCAPSLNNGFYISKKFNSKAVLPLADNAEIFIFKESKLTKITAEDFFNLFTQTDAFATEGYRAPFLVEIENEKMQRVESQYTP